MKRTAPRGTTHAGGQSGDPLTAPYRPFVSFSFQRIPSTLELQRRDEGQMIHSTVRMARPAKRLREALESLPPPVSWSQGTELERRRAGQIRFPVRVPVVAEPDVPAGSPVPGETQNLSRSGALLRVKGARMLGVPVRVTLRLRPHASITLAGTVVWSRPHADFPGWEQGIQFRTTLPGDFLGITDETFPPRGARPARGAAGETARVTRPLQGILLGCVLGFAVWMGAGLGFLRAVGYLPHVPTSLWWALGCLLIGAVVAWRGGLQNHRSGALRYPTLQRKERPDSVAW